MRSVRKEHKDKLEKEIRREYKEWRRLPTGRWGDSKAGEYVELDKPILDGYDLVLFVDLKESDERKKILEECYSKLYTKIHSSGKEFRKCDCRKSMRYRPWEDVEFDSYFTNNKLDFEKVTHYVLTKIHEYDYNKLSDDAKKYFMQCPAYNWHGNLLKNQFDYKFVDRDHISYHFEIRPHYITYQFIPDGETISRVEFLNKRLWVDMLWYTVLSEGEKRVKWENRLRRKARSRKEFADAMLEYEREMEEEGRGLVRL